MIEILKTAACVALTFFMIFHMFVLGIIGLFVIEVLR